MPMPITAILIRKRSSQALQIGHPSNVDVRPRTKYVELEYLQGENLINEFNWNWGDFSPPDSLSKKVRIREYVHLDSWRRAQTFLLIQTVQKVHNSNAIVGQSYKGLKHSLEISGLDLVEMWEKVKRQKARVVAINWSHVAIVPFQSPWLVGCQHIFCKGSCRLSIKMTPHPLWHFTSPISPSFLRFAGPCFSSISDIECHQSVCLQSSKNMFSMQWCTWDRAKEHIVRLICAAVHMNVGHSIHCKDETTCRIMIPCIDEVQYYLKCETTRKQAAADSSDSKTKPPIWFCYRPVIFPILPHF